MIAILVAVVVFELVVIYVAFKRLDARIWKQFKLVVFVTSTQATQIVVKKHIHGTRSKFTYRNLTAEQENENADNV